ncbi:MAG: hypothetical protein JXA98_00155 [Methanosarcinaceae archaeon]|nr:hypothetical protein [Methanosarcinaceae archaeon]
MQKIKKQFAFIGTFIFLIIFFASSSSADWNQTSTEVNASYEVISEDMTVHVSKVITFKNNDANTRYWRGYYSTFNYYLPDDAKNICAYDNDRDLNFHKLDRMDHYYVLKFNTKVWYEESYTFTIEYDIDIHKNCANFCVNEHGNETQVTIIIPDEYETFMDRNDYSMETISDAVVYTFDHGLVWSNTCRVDAVKNTDIHVLKGTANLKEKNVDITVNYWDGEEEWANDILNTAIETLPVLEDLSGLSYPMDYNITITEATITETSGYGGSNNGKNGIILLHTEGRAILVHELSHYWTRACNFENIWMDEGYADLYTYLVLNQTHPDEAYSRKELFFDQYETLKPIHDFPLSNWTVPESFEDGNALETSYGYKKSFVLMYNLYEDAGLEAIQKTNLEFSNSNDGIDIDEYVKSMESATDKSLNKEWELVMPV